MGERLASRGLRPARLEIRSLADLTTSVQYLDRNVKGRSPMSMPKDSDQEARPMDLEGHERCYLMNQEIGAQERHANETARPWRNRG